MTTLADPMPPLAVVLHPAARERLGLAPEPQLGAAGGSRERARRLHKAFPSAPEPVVLNTNMPATVASEPGS